MIIPFLMVTSAVAILSLSVASCHQSSAPKRQAELCLDGGRPVAILRKTMQAIDLRYELLPWHVIRFVAKTIGAFSANLAADAPGCLNGCSAVGGSLFVNSQVVRSTGQEKVMAKKASAAGTRIVPLGDRVVLKRAEAEEKTAGGILLPDSAQGKPQRGEVIAVGDGHTNDKGGKIPLSVKEGDRVIFSSYAGDEISVGDVTYLLMRESDILAKV